LSLAEGEWQNSLVAVAKSDARKHKLGNVRQMCLGNHNIFILLFLFFYLFSLTIYEEETDQKDRNSKERSEAERELDNLTAEVATLHVIKKAVQVYFGLFH
jgi:hypothetical protein